jgi:hypothetical protein
MTATPPMSRPTQPPEQMPRCCPSHADWTVLRTHLASQFPSVATVRIEDEINRAREATDLFGLSSSEQLPAAEIVARHSLMLLTGQIEDNSRLDPEVHHRSCAEASFTDQPTTSAGLGRPAATK